MTEAKARGVLVEQDELGRISVTACHEQDGDLARACRDLLPVLQAAGELANMVEAQVGRDLDATAYVAIAQLLQDQLQKAYAKRVEEEAGAILESLTNDLLQRKPQ